jgi:hypothetical protein
MFQQTRFILRTALVLSAMGVLIPQARSWTLQNLEVSKSAATSCTPPPPATSFSVTDGNAYEYFLLQGLKAGDQVSLRWVTPNTGIYYTTTWNKLSAAGNYCFTGSYLTNSQYRQYPGGWWVEVYVNGQYQNHAPFTVTAPCTVTSMTATVNTTCASSNPWGCQANLLLARYGESSALQLQVAPSQAALVTLSTSFGNAPQSLTTGTDGSALPLYSVGPAGSISDTQTVAATVSGSACGKQFSNLATVYNYNSFDIHQSLISNAVYTNPNGFTATAIQTFFVAKNSFLANFYFAGSTGGYIDTNKNGRYDAGEPSYPAGSKTFPVGTTGTRASDWFFNRAQAYGINAKLLVIKAQVEHSLISTSSLPVDGILNSALGCQDGHSNNFYDQVTCSANTFANRYHESSFNGRPLNYPFWFRTTDGIKHAVKGNCDGSGCVLVAFPVYNTATYVQYRYTPYVQSKTDGGGVYLLELLWRQYGF